MTTTTTETHDTPPATAELLTFFKALADPSRLRIVGFLAQRSHTVEELAAALGTSNSTASHHLKRLTAAGLVDARPDGYYRHYSLRDQALRDMSSRLLDRSELPRLAGDVHAGTFERKVLATFFDDSGHITAFPVQAKKFRVVIQHVAKAFEESRRYSEREVNEILRRFSDDTATLRRSLVELGFMGREGGGGAYWRETPVE